VGAREREKIYTGKESLPKKGACRAPFITKQSSFNGPDAGLSISIHESKPIICMALLFSQVS